MNEFKVILVPDTSQMVFYLAISSFIDVHVVFGNIFWIFFEHDLHNNRTLSLLSLLPVPSFPPSRNIMRSVTDYVIYTYFTCVDHLHEILYALLFIGG